MDILLMFALTTIASIFLLNDDAMHHDILHLVNSVQIFVVI